MSEATCTDSNGDKWRIYKDKADEWRWNRKASNGETVGSSSEGYKNKADCINNAKRHSMHCNPT